MTLLIVGAIIAVILLAWFGIYNGLVKTRNWAKESFSQIDVQLQRRNDLIPNLVETVKGYAAHEKETLDAVIKARQQLIDVANASPEQINAASNALSSTLSRLLAVAEAYPDLKANTNFTELQRSLTDTEDKIAKARMLYNSSINQYNTKIQVVPNNIVAGVHGFQPMAYLETPQEARQVPQVKF
ncbi:LemA family protein [Tuanshanicoccus lijuaniae]|uniref:LemA family protein n=1 Tax=Aerococcaceae bacterium zg-1292 TaxID=2774330 RepID=UPI001935E527|nr:LemA family protein [Aerococcaceae bacterium zg-1292]MBF6626111.1 LemA family protein [Aerococcaceae bacterium zg-BR9]MBF6978799.1 LemA family protein [Aerococcaceae bacterium zg-BR22]MBS4455234.1 LemA family protein [Aerococcaceae bacterium zg-A91]MBS4457956.1 LemA family protein [Aerococcaceae bacterium zg-BR33]